MRFCMCIVALVGMIFLTSCEDDKPVTPGPMPATLTGTVRSLSGGGVISDAQLALIDPTNYIVAAGPVATDGAGVYTFTSPPVGTFFLFVFTDDQAAVEPAALEVVIAADQSFQVDVDMVDVELWNGAGFAVSGKVIDAVTKEPIAGAFVSQYFGTVFHSFLGIALPYECITDADGTYILKGAPSIRDAGGNVTGIFPVAASKEGYDLFVTTTLPVPAPPDTVLSLDIEMSTGGATGSLRGRVLLDGTPVEGVPVALDYYSNPFFEPAPGSKGDDRRDPDRVPVLGKTQTTDENGEYWFTDLTPGYYTVEAGYLPNDGYVVTVFSGQAQHMVTSNQETMADDIIALKAFKPISPDDGMVITDATPTFVWERCPGADFYRLTYSDGWVLDEIVGAIADTMLVMPDSLSFENGQVVRWLVDAFDSAGQIGGFDRIPSFTVELAPASD